MRRSDGDISEIHREGQGGHRNPDVDKWFSWFSGCVGRLVTVTMDVNVGTVTAKDRSLFGTAVSKVGAAVTAERKSSSPSREVKDGM